MVSCILSLRTRDTVSLPASLNLFEVLRTPIDFAHADVEHIQSLIKSVGFYRQKSINIKKLSLQIINEFGGEVPRCEEDLLSLAGVGRKTANLVLSVGFEIPAICVDTHVHRLSNQWGLVKTRSPEETEQALKEIVPQKFWIEINELMVMWGQFKCKPQVRVCTECALLNVSCIKEKRAKKITR